MDFELFKRKMKSEPGPAAQQGPPTLGLVYHGFVAEMFEVLRSRRYPDFTERECAESLGILRMRFGSFLGELDLFPCDGNEDAEFVKRRMGEALVEMLQVLEELQGLAATPEDERIAPLLERFRVANEVILEINQEMATLAAERRL